MSEINGNRVEINRAYLRQTGEAKCISILFLLYLPFISSSHSYSFFLQIGFQLRNSYFLEVEDTCR